MLVDADITAPSISEVLDLVNPAGISDILQNIDTQLEIKDIFAEAGPRKGWHADNSDLARCDLSEEHIHMFPKVGLRVMAVWKRTIKGLTLAEIKSDDDIIPLFANKISDLISVVLGSNLSAGHYAVITTPRRRHKERNFACLVAEGIADRLHIPYREDVAFARTKQRVNVDFTLGYLPPEPNLICFDDFVTTGSTLGAMNRLLAPFGKNIIYFTGVDNQ